MSAALTPHQLARLRDNGATNAARTKRGEERVGVQPVAKVTARDGREWLLFELDPDDGDLVFAECRRRNKPAEKLWLRLSWLDRQIVQVKRFGRVRKVPA